MISYFREKNNFSKKNTKTSSTENRSGIASKDDYMLEKQISISQASNASDVERLKYKF